MTPWLSIARDEYLRGVAEVPGPEHHRRILRYHASTVLGATSDEVPWCSSFVNWVLAEAGHQDVTRSARALSWLRWGVDVPPALGAVGIIRNPVRRGRGHVGFVAGYDAQMRIVLLGGNQDDSVCYRAYPRRRFESFRLPAGWALDPLPYVEPDGVGGRTR